MKLPDCRHRAQRVVIMHSDMNNDDPLLPGQSVR